MKRVLSFILAIVISLSFVVWTSAAESEKIVIDIDFGSVSGNLLGIGYSWDHGERTLTVYRNGAKTQMYRMINALPKDASLIHQNGIFYDWKCNGTVEIGENATVAYGIFQSTSCLTNYGTINGGSFTSNTTT